MISHIVYANEKLRQLQTERQTGRPHTVKPDVCCKQAAGAPSRRVPAWWPFRRGKRNTVAVCG